MISSILQERKLHLTHKRIQPHGSLLGSFPLHRDGNSFAENSEGVAPLLCRAKSPSCSGCTRGGNLRIQSFWRRLSGSLPVSSVTCAPTRRSTWAPNSAASHFVLKISGFGDLPATPSFHLPGFLSRFSCSLCSPGLRFYCSLLLCCLFILAAHVLVSPSAAISREAARGYLIHQVLLNS